MELIFRNDKRKENLDENDGCCHSVLLVTAANAFLCTHLMKVSEIFKKKKKGRNMLKLKWRRKSHFTLLMA